MATPRKVKLKNSNANVLQDSPTLRQPKRYHLGRVVDSGPTQVVSKSQDTEPVETAQNTAPTKSISEEQHAALGARKKSSSKPSPGDTEPEHLAVVQVPTSPEPDSALPNLSDEQPVTGNFRELPEWQTPSYTSERAKSFKPDFTEEPYGKAPIEQVKSGYHVSTIWWLGGSLIIANLVTKGTATSLMSKVFNKPEGVGPTKTPQGQEQLREFIGEVFFLIILGMIARLFPSMTRPIIIFILGLWLVWIIFQLPDAIKRFQTEGPLAVFGLTGDKTTTSSSSGTQQKSAPGHGKTNPSTGVTGGSYYEQGYTGRYNYSIGV